VKAYVFSFDGYVIGATAVVIAENESEAREKLAQEIDSRAHKLDCKRIDLDKVVELTDSATCVYFDNGDM